MISPQEIVERALDMSSAAETVVIVDEESEANLRWAANSLTTNGVTRNRTVTVVAVDHDRTGVVSRQGLADGGGLDELVEAACQAAASAEPAEDRNPLFGAAESSGDWTAPPADTGIGVFGRFAFDLGQVFAEARGSRLLYGFAYHRMTSTFVGSSSGLRARYDQPTGHAEINAKSNDLSASCWAGTPTADFTDVDVAALDADLRTRLSWSERRTDLPAGRYDVVLPPSAVADMMIYLYWSAEGREAYEGRTVFSRPGGGTKVGDTLTAQPVTLLSDPRHPGLECAPFLTARRSGASRSVFDNGAPLRRTEWISGGRLQALVQTRHSSDLTGLPFTPYVDNLVLSSTDPAGSVPDLVGGIERGLLLTCLWYIREVDPTTLLLTGLTRDGVFLVEGGEITGAVNNFRFNESPLDLLARASQVGKTERTLPREWSDYFTRTAMPAVRVPDFNMSSVSQAS